MLSAQDVASTSLEPDDLALTSTAHTRGKGGRLVTSGATSGPIGPTDIRYLFRREHRIIGSNGWTHTELLRLAAHAFAGRVTPVVDRVLPLERTVEGEVALADRSVFGKVVITPDAA